MEFTSVVLTEVGDYLVQEKQDIDWTENGLRIENPYIVNEEGKAQKLQADNILVTENALQAIQHGEFEEETL